MLYRSYLSLKQVQPYSVFEEAGVRHATLSALHFDVDGHGANPRLCGIRRMHIIEKTGKTPMVSIRHCDTCFRCNHLNILQHTTHFGLATLPVKMFKDVLAVFYILMCRHCGNHVQNLIDNSVIESADQTLFAGLGVGALFFRMGANFIRLIHATPAVISAKWKPPIAAQDPPPLATLAGDELQDYVLKNYKAFAYDAAPDACWSSDSEVEGPEQPELGPKQLKKRHFLVKQAWTRFRSVFNGHIWRDDIAGMPDIHLSQLSGTASAAKAKAPELFVNIFFRSLPLKPNLKKWTKYGQALDWHLVALGCCNFLPQLYKPAYQKIDLRVVKNAAAAVGKDPEVQELSWHELESKRHKAYGSVVAAPATLRSVIVLCIVLEPCRWLARWFMRRSSQWRRARAQRRGKAPPVCDMTWLEASPAVRVLQYLSQLLSGRASRLTLLWSRRCDSWEDFCTAEPDTLLMLRRTVQVASAEIEMRHFRPYFQLPFSLCSIVDHRRPVDQRRALAGELERLRDCAELHDAWFFPQLCAHFANADELMAATMQRFLHCWSWTIVMTICQNEFCHGRNRTRAHESQAWAQFAAHSYNQEQMKRLKWAKEAHTDKSQRRARRAPAMQVSKLQRKTSAFERFRLEKIAALTGNAAHKLRITSLSFNQQLREEWAEVVADQDRLLRFEQEAAKFNLEIDASQECHRHQLSLAGAAAPALVDRGPELLAGPVKVGASKKVSSSHSQQPAVSCQ